MPDVDLSDEAIQERKDRIAELRAELRAEKRAERTETRVDAREAQVRSLEEEEDRLLRQLAELRGEEPPESTRPVEVVVPAEPVVQDAPRVFDMGGGQTVTEEPHPLPVPTPTPDVAPEADGDTEVTRP